MYLQERILRLLLAHLDIIFLPLNIASTDQTSDIKTLGPAGVTLLSRGGESEG